MGDMADDARNAEDFASGRRLQARLERQRRERAQVDPGRANRLARVAASLPLGPDNRPPWLTEPGAERFGGEPPVGTVLRWEHAGDPTTIVVGRRHDVGWDVSGYDRLIRWPEVADMIGDRPCQVAVAWREIPAPAPEPSGDDAVRDWAARFLPDSTVPNEIVEHHRQVTGDRLGMNRLAADSAAATYGADRMTDEPPRDASPSEVRETPGPMINTRPAGERD